MSRIHILAISGSLRAGSSNTAILESMREDAPSEVEMTLAAPLDRLPHFNPDHDGDDPPAAVRTWRDELARADALVISTPEYAHGVPGVLKNALDWAVSSGELGEKPVALVAASAAGAPYAEASLRETLSVLCARTSDATSLRVAAVRRKVEGGLVVDDGTARELRRVIDALVAQVRAVRPREDGAS